MAIFLSSLCADDSFVSLKYFQSSALGDDLELTISNKRVMQCDIFSDTKEKQSKILSKEDYTNLLKEIEGLQHDEFINEELIKPGNAYFYLSIDEKESQDKKLFYGDVSKIKKDSKLYRLYGIIQSAVNDCKK